MKKRGFTLIELLAVILILGIIALIAIPTINDIITSAQKGAFERTADALVKLVQEECTTNMIKGTNYNVAYNFSKDKKTDISVKGKLPSSGGVMITDDQCNVSINVSDGKFCALKSANSDKIITGLIVDGMCVADEVNIPSCTNEDTNPGELRGTGTTGNPYLIESIEDLYAMKKMSAAETQDKYFKLIVDLDFKDNCSYKDPTNTTYGDINKDGTTKGIKEEITTGRGFIFPNIEPNAFAGNFDGNNKVIRNLYIKGTGDNDYAGLFEKVQNTTTPIYIKNLALENVNITNMNSKVGGLIASIEENTNINVSNINLSGNISASSTIGGIIGESNSTSGSIFNNLTFNGKIYCTDKHCAGILGNQNETVLVGESPIKVTNIKSIADVTAETLSGAVIGQGYGMELNNVYAYGKLSNVELTKSWQGWIAGIAGKLTINNKYVLQNIYNYAYIEVDRYIGYVGGIFGELSFITDYRDVNSSERALLKKIYNYGNIDLLSTYGTVGGIAGSVITTDCYDCYNHGNIIEKDMAYGSGVSGLIGIIRYSSIVNSGNYGNVSGYENVSAIGRNNTDVVTSNSVNYGEINCVQYCSIMSGEEIKNSYTIGKFNFINYGATFNNNYGGSVENVYAKEEIYADGPSDQSYSFQAYGFGPSIALNSAFIGSLTKNDANDRSLTDSSWINSIDLMNSWNTTYNNVYYSKIGGNATTEKGISVPFNNVTTSWFRDTVNLGNNFLYEEGYYPRVYKVDMNGNVTNELVEGQTKIAIR